MITFVSYRLRDHRSLLDGEHRLGREVVVLPEDYTEANIVLSRAHNDDIAVISDKDILKCGHIRTYVRPEWRERVDAQILARRSGRDGREG